MKKKLLVVALIGMMLCGCNHTMLDTNYYFDRAIIKVGEEWKEVKVKSWCDYDGEQLQIVAEDGTVYLTSSFNCTLITDP